MSTTGWRVGTSVVSQPELAQRRDASCGPLGGSALPLEHVGANASRRSAARMAVQELLGLVRLCGDPGAFAQLQHRLLRGRPVAAGARDEDPSCVGRAPHRRAPPRRLRRARRRPRRAATRALRPRTCSSPCGTTSARPPGVQTITSLRELGERRVGCPVTSQLVPGERPRRLERESVSPSCETHTIRSASGGARTASSACIAAPPVCAAWNDVPQPVCTTRAPSGSRRSTGTARSQSGWARTARRVSPGISASIPSRR